MDIVKDSRETDGNTVEAAKVGWCVMLVFRPYAWDDLLPGDASIVDGFAGGDSHCRNYRLEQAKNVEGADSGVITINLDEADTVAREFARQQFHDPNRTLIGHFRREASHCVYLTHVEVAGKTQYSK